MQKLNKRANSGTVALWGIFIVIVILAISGIVYVATGTKQQAVGSEGQTVEGSTGSGITLVTTNPLVNIQGTDAQQSGTTVGTGVSKYSVNSDNSYSTVTLGTTTAIPGQVIRLLLVNGTSYHNAVWNLDGKIKVEANSFPVNVQFNKNATITESVYYQNTKLANGVGTNNITDLGNGASYSLTDEMQANALTNTQDMLCIIELTAGVNASVESPGVTYDGKLSENIETSSFYTPAGTSSKIYTFTRPAISSTKPVSANILLNTKSTGRFSGGTYVKKSCYTNEWFVDPSTGKLTYGVVDSQGTVKSMAIYTQTNYFQ
jgi:hypothetical protein